MVEQRRDEVVVQPLHVEGEDRQAIHAARTVEVQPRVARETVEGALPERDLVGDDPLGAQHLLHEERTARAEVGQDGGRPPLLPLVETVGVIDVLRIEAAHVVHRAAAGALGRAGTEEVAVRHEDPGPAGPAGELVGRDEDRVHPSLRVARGMHVDGHVGAGGRVVEARRGAAPVERAGHAAHVGDHARHVRRRREGADPERPLPDALQLGRQVPEVDMA